MEDNKNVYERLQNVRAELIKVEMKKSGKNTFQKYNYFELQDFLPAIQELCNKHGIVPLVSFKDNEAIMTIVNTTNKDDFIEFKCPFVLSELKGATRVQCLGGSITYLRRYLYQTAFEICESDGFDILDKEKIEEFNENKEIKIKKIKDNLKNEAVVKKMKEIISREEVQNVNELSEEAIDEVLKELN